MNKLWFGVVFGLAMLPGAVVAETVNLDLNLLPPAAGTNRITIGVEALGFSDSETSDISGVLNVDLNASFDSSEIASATGLTVIENQSSVAATDANFQLNLGIFGTLEVNTLGLGGTVRTPSPPGPVSGTTFNASDHQIVLNQGTITNSLTSDDIDLSISPVIGTTVATGILAVSTPTITAHVATYDVTATLPVNFTDDFVVDIGFPVTVTVSASGGSVVGAGSFTRIIAPEGDYNYDGVVDAADYTVWRDNLGSTSALAADGSLNSLIDNADYFVWRNNFGATDAELEQLGLVIPEPTSFALLGLSGLALLHRRR